MDQQFEFFSVGQIVPEFAIGTDGYRIEYNEATGLVLYCYFNRPTPEEVDAFDCSQPFRICFTTYRNVGFFCVKFGNMPWGDCSFHPCIYPEPPVFAPLLDGLGYALNVFLIDSATGKILRIRTIGLGHRFSVFFRNWCREQLTVPMTRGSYTATVELAHGNFSTKNLVKMAAVTWAI